MESAAVTLVKRDLGGIVQIGGTPPSALLKSFGIEIATKYGEA